LGHKSVSALLVLTIAFFQFPALFYVPASQIPTKADRDTGNRIVEMIKGIDGDVFFPRHGYLAELAGKKSYAHDCAINDVWRGTDQVVSLEMRNAIDQAIDEKRFQAIILDTQRCIYMDAINENYVFDKSVCKDKSTFWPIAGYWTRPESLFVLRP